MTVGELYQSLTAHLRRQAHLANVMRLLEWDQATYMPAGALSTRAEQLALLAMLVHQATVEPGFLALVDELHERSSELGEEQQRNLREVKWQADRVRQLPADFVAERARVHATGRAAWAEARTHDDFSILAPALTRVVQVEREFAAYVDSRQDPYQVLLEEYEPGASARNLEQLFTVLTPACQDLLHRAPMGEEVRWQGPFPVAEQHRLCTYLLEWLGFDFRRGRLDESLHPFSITVGQDHRITTRYDEADLREALFSTLHEAGHALYEQGLDSRAYGLPRGIACSLGMHEAQSRLWENLIGRHEQFWQFLWPKLVALFPSLASSGVNAVVQSVNQVRPSLIRTDADEVSYNLHIALRFSLERALIAGALAVEDLPAAWNQGMQDLLGVRPQSDREGVLQDIHWPSGAFGYFPTYSLGNVFAVQLFRAMGKDLGDLGKLLQNGEFHPIREWLHERIFCFGRLYRARELMRRATGQEPSPEPLLAYLREKVERLGHGRA